jgi:hypothetical protein
VWLAAELSEAALTASLLAALRTLRPGERFAHFFVEEYRIERAIQAYERVIDESLAVGGKG